MYSPHGLLMDRRELLKIKIASLVAEAGIIRAAEQKQKLYGRKARLATPFLLNQMREHRVGSVRRAIRLAGLALAIIRGRNLTKLESPLKHKHPLTKDDWEQIRTMVRRYGGLEGIARFSAAREQLEGVAA